MKRVLVKTCLFLPLLLGVVAVNLRQMHYERGAAALLLAHVNVAGGGYDDRWLQRDYIRGVPERKDLVVLGSSRAMQVRSGLFPGMSFYNCNICSAGLADLIASYEMFAARDMRPATLVLVLDPWLLNRNAVLTHGPWSLAAEYHAGKQRMGLYSTAQTRYWLVRDRWAGYLPLLAPSYLQAAIGRGDGPSGRYYPTTASEGETETRLVDGSCTYARAWRSRSVTEVRQSAVAWTQIERGFYEQYEALDPTLTREFETFVEYLQKQRIRVVFLLAPYHPVAYPRMLATDHFRMVAPAERYFVSFAHRQRIDVVGSYDPARLGCDESEFFDASHPKPACINRIFRDHARRGDGHGDGRIASRRQ